MKAGVFDANGKKVKEIDLPDCFSQEIREDIVLRVLEAKKRKQPYAPSPLAGKQYSAKGKLVHRRHVWKSQYGRGISRVPRKIFLRRGEQFLWEAAEVPQARGGIRAHPPKILSMFKRKKINKKELKIAFISALSATAKKEEVEKKYKIKIEKLPIILKGDFLKLKTKDLITSLKKVLGEMFEKSIKRRKIRAGKGKLRGRKYKKSAGMLLVIGEKERLKTGLFDVRNVKNLSVTDLAKGGLGRFTIYTEDAIKELKKKFGEKGK